MSKMSNGRTTFEYRKECIQRGPPYVNYMRMLSVAQQHDRNMCRELKGLCHVRGKGKSRIAWWISDKHKGNEMRKMMTNVKSWRQDVECQELWLWVIRLRKNDSRSQKEERWWLKMSEWGCTTALNTKSKWRWRHRMLSWTMDLNTKTKTRLWTPNWRRWWF